MKKRILALLLVLALLPAVPARAAQAGFAESQMDFTQACITQGQILTLRSLVVPGGQGGYSQAVYAVELKGTETKAELDALAVELLKSGAEPLAGGYKHCYHGGAYTAEPEYAFRAADFGTGTYLYVCYAFGCSGGSYSHVLEPYYEKISTTAVRVVEEERPLGDEYFLHDGAGAELAVFAAGDTVTMDLNGGDVYLGVRGQGSGATERILSAEVRYDAEYAAQPFTLDEKTWRISPYACGAGSITLTIAPYADGGAARQETVTLSCPCAPRGEVEVLVDSTCTGEGLALRVCHGWGTNCETVFGEEILPARGHEVYSVSQIVIPPTATQPGVGLGTCKICGSIGEEAEIPPIFTDTVPDGFYSAALDYCYENGLVMGTSENTFSPAGLCQRAAVVTFLWRAEGCPEPAGAENPFVDVKASDFYYKAVLWAVEQGITNGTDAAHFSPYAVCSRGQVVTFLHRAFGSPEPGTEGNPFTDVAGDSWYAAPVLWAVENGITNGLTATQFGPNANCNRAQVVTFLYRAYAQ